VREAVKSFFLESSQHVFPMLN